MTAGHPWRRRQEFPDALVRDAADQFESARAVLAAQPGSSGVLLPLMNSAAVAIELYLKCLATELVYTPDEMMPEISVVTAKPSRKGHKLTEVFDQIATDDRDRIEARFRADYPEVCGGLRQQLALCEGAFSASRYPYEAGADVSRFPLNVLMACSLFLSEYVRTLVPEHRIEWKAPIV